VGVDGLYFRVSSERQTTENQFEELVRIAEKDDSARDWCRVSVFPVRSQTGPINATMGKLLWAIQAWYAEKENDEGSDAIKAGLVRARASGTQIGRPRAVFRRDEVPVLRQQGLSWRQISSKLGVSIGSARRRSANLATPQEDLLRRESKTFPNSFTLPIPNLRVNLGTDTRL